MVDEVGATTSLRADSRTASDNVNPPVLSVITPAYNEAENLPALYDQLRSVLTEHGVSWEWIVVDDHSWDGTFATITAIARAEPSVRGVRLARNAGSHAAIACGLHRARGACAVVLAADLQDPPEVIPSLLARWRDGAQVVWAAREHREGERRRVTFTARAYYFIMRRVIGMADIPPRGADFFLLDRRVMEAFHLFGESNLSILALFTWMGFRQDQILYIKRARSQGQSGWTLEKKLRLVVDSITAFTSLPIRLMSYLGFIVGALGLVYAGVVFIRALGGVPVEGWASLMIVVLVIGGVQMLMLGVLGEYLWRALAEARRRPRYLVEATSDEDLA